MSIENDTTKMSLLSDKALLQHIVKGSVVIEPFCYDNLNTSSYDVTLGEYYFREALSEPGVNIYNPYSETSVKKRWGEPLKAEKASDFTKRTGMTLENIYEDDHIIWLQPGETILAHTNEYVGGVDTVTTMMKARSSMGRNFISVCKCAGWGDIGYINRWTLEITSHSQNAAIPLVVGRRIAQIVFFDSDGTISGRSYADGGKYQSSPDLVSLKKNWSPYMCLPKMYNDKEIKKGAFNLDAYNNAVSGVEAARILLEKHYEDEKKQQQ